MDAAHTAQRRGTLFLNQHADGKTSVRARLTALRRALHPADVAARGARVQARLLASPDFQEAQTVALYASLPGEVPTDAVFAAALAAGKTVCFPVVPAQGRRLAFRSVTRASDLVPPGKLAIREPDASCPDVGLEVIDLFVVPGVGFTRACHRLGQGGGYYDATLAAASPRSRRVGLAFSEHVLATLPVTPTDVPVDAVVTEDATFQRPARARL